MQLLYTCSLDPKPLWAGTVSDLILHPRQPRAWHKSGALYMLKGADTIQTADSCLSGNGDSAAAVAAAADF